jgi:hypothetical protein
MQGIVLCLVPTRSLPPKTTHTPSPRSSPPYTHPLYDTHRQDDTVRVPCRQCLVAKFHPRALLPYFPPTRFERLLPWLRSNYDGRSRSKRSRRRGRSDCRHGSALTCRLAGCCGCKCGRRSVERPTIEIDRSPPLTPPLPSPFWSSISHRWTTTTTRMRTTRRSGARP